MVFRVRSTPTRFPINCLHTPMDSVWSPWGSTSVVSFKCMKGTATENKRYPPTYPLSYLIIHWSINPTPYRWPIHTALDPHYRPEQRDSGCYEKAFSRITVFGHPIFHRSWHKIQTLIDCLHLDCLFFTPQFVSKRHARYQSNFRYLMYPLWFDLYLAAYKFTRSLTSLLRSHAFSNSCYSSLNGSQPVGKVRLEYFSGNMCYSSPPALSAEITQLWRFQKG